jgi:putative nucleotidyltransferase with HDIG domain
LSCLTLSSACWEAVLLPSAADVGTGASKIAMNRAAYGVIVAAALGAACALLLVPWAPLIKLDAAGLAGLAAFVFVTAASEATALRAVVNGNKVRFSVSFLPLLAIIMVFPPAGGITAVIALNIVIHFGQPGRSVWILVANVSQSVIVVAIASWIYALLGGSYSYGYSDIIPITALVLTFVASNVLLVSLFFAARQGQALTGVIRRLVGPGGANLLYDVVASPYAVVMAIMYSQLYIVGLVLVSLPIILLRASYLSKLRSEEAVQDILRVLVKAIETRDPYTSGHSLRVATLSKLIGEDVGVRGRDLEELERAALLHDIGKVDATYTGIISKPMLLTEDERVLIQTHADKGADLLGRLASISPRVIAGVRHHHERYDGSGYPGRLAGQGIPLFSRIIMLSDSIDAMLSDRPYRNALTKEAVERELAAHAGAQFDPDIVDAILKRETIDKALRLLGEIDADVDVMSVVGR